MKLKQIPLNTVVHTPTEEEAKELLAILRENGWKINGAANYAIKNAKGIQIESETDWSWWGKIENARKENRTILTLAEFKRLYHEEEKPQPQPKFKVGDKVRIIQDGTVNPDYVGIVDEIAEVGSIIKLRNTDSNWDEEVLEPYTEPEIKPEAKEAKEDAKRLNLLEILKGCEVKTFYSPCFGELTLRETDCDSLLLTTARGISERFNLDGRLWTAVSTGMPMLFPSRELYVKYPLDPYTAWMKWQEEQKKHWVSVTVWIDDIECESDTAVDTNKIYFRTPADRDQCIEEIKAVIEKYSKE